MICHCIASEPAITSDAPIGISASIASVVNATSPDVTDISLSRSRAHHNAPPGTPAKLMAHSGQTSGDACPASEYPHPGQRSWESHPVRFACSDIVVSSRESTPESAHPHRDVSSPCRG